MKKTVILLSGGIDSTTCLARALESHDSKNVYTLNIVYGQKHDKESKSAEKIAQYYGVDYKLMDLSQIFKFSNCSLLKHSTEEMKYQSYDEQLKAMGGQGTVSTYVPFRNGLMLSSAASYALSVDATTIYYGAHSDDAAGSAYPDCTPQFVEHMNNAIYEGSGKILTIISPYINLTKADIVKDGLALNAPYHLSWSCYDGKEKPCGTCGTCIDRKKAFAQNNAIDPIIM